MVGVDMFFTDTAIVETFLGESAYGGIFAAPQTVPCFVDDATHLVIASTGREVVSQTVVYTAAANADLFTVESKVTVKGRHARVITLNGYDSGPSPLPFHTEVHLT